jgi:ABC-type hemin transport system substrate-binding protein
VPCLVLETHRAGHYFYLDILEKVMKKNITFRRKGAIERLEKNIADYTSMMKETVDKDVMKTYQQKIERHQTTIANTKKNMTN